MRRLIWLVVLELLGFGLMASAQQVGPLVAEGGKGRAKGEFTVSNLGVTPLITTVEAVTFRLTPEGKSVYIALEPTSVVKLTDTSAKIGPRQQHVFAYEVQCNSPQPCLIALLPRMVQAVHVTEGIQLGLIIPHSIYLCTDRAKDCRKRVRQAAGIPDAR